MSIYVKNILVKSIISLITKLIITFVSKKIIIKC